MQGRWISVKTLAEELRSALAKLGSGKLRWKLAEIAIETAMIVFAVLVALGVEEWREERQLHSLADRARVAVDLELQQNLTEFRRAEAKLIEGREEIANAMQVVIEIQRGTRPSTDFELGFTLGFPEVSAAAWRVAQVSQAATYLDYDWLVERARQYDALERYLDFQDQVITAVGLVAATGDEEEDTDDAIIALRQVYGRLEILLQLHASLQEGMATYLRESDRLP